jgi:hypothetical protein
MVGAVAKAVTPAFRASVQRYSMATFCPSTYRVSLSPLRSAASDRLDPRVGLITGIAACCARAASGQTAAPPSPAMNSRRRISRASQPLYGSSVPQPQVSEQSASGLGTKFLRYFVQRGRPQLMAHSWPGRVPRHACSRRKLTQIQQPIRWSTHGNLLCVFSTSAGTPPLPENARIRGESNSATPPPAYTRPPASPRTGSARRRGSI